jgi:hypothetical protein
MTTPLHPDADIKVLDAAAANNQDGLEGLETKDLWLGKLQRLSCRVKAALSLTRPNKLIIWCYKQHREPDSAHTHDVTEYLCSLLAVTPFQAPPDNRIKLIAPKNYRIQ